MPDHPLLKCRRPQPQLGWSPRGMAQLGTGLAISTVVENDDGKVRRALKRNRRKATQAHQGFAITGDDCDRDIGLSKRQTQPHLRGAAMAP